MATIEAVHEAHSADLPHLWFVAPDRKDLGGPKMAMLVVASVSLGLSLALILTAKIAKMREMRSTRYFSVLEFSVALRQGRP